MMNNPQQQKFQSKNLLVNAGLNNNQSLPNNLTSYQTSTSPQSFQSVPVLATPSLPIQSTFIQQQRLKQ